jgi:DNA-binding LytR/AlgR family response regulator
MAPEFVMFEDAMTKNSVLVATRHIRFIRQTPHGQSMIEFDQGHHVMVTETIDAVKTALGIEN